MNLNNIQLNQQSKILIVIFFALIVYVDSSFILKAQSAGLKRLDPKITKLNTDILNLNRGLENMRSAKINPDSAAQKKAARIVTILSENQIPVLLQEISTAANRFNIKIAQLRPSRQTQKEKSPVGQDKLIAMLVNLDLTADYHSLGKFIQALENSPVFMGVQELEISTQLPEYLKQKVTLVLKTYVTK